MRFLGSASVFPHVQGMFRERLVMGETHLTTVAEDISLGELACAEPLSIGLHAVPRAGTLTDKTVLVTGGGTIGCMSVLAARLQGLTLRTVDIVISDSNFTAKSFPRLGVPRYPCTFRMETTASVPFIVTAASIFA